MINSSTIETHDFKYTQYIIINSDVKMGKGKAIAQGCHASLGSYLDGTDLKLAYEWKLEGARKVVLRASENEIMELYNKISNEHPNIPTYLVKDFGLTQIPAGSITALGIGPYLIYRLKEYVKDLRLV